MPFLHNSKRGGCRPHCYNNNSNFPLFPIRFLQLSQESKTTSGHVFALFLLANQRWSFLDSTRGSYPWCWPKGSQPLGTRLGDAQNGCAVRKIADLVLVFVLVVDSNILYYQKNVPPFVYPFRLSYFHLKFSRSWFKFTDLAKETIFHPPQGGFETKNKSWSLLLIIINSEDDSNAEIFRVIFQHVQSS